MNKFIFCLLAGALMLSGCSKKSDANVNDSADITILSAQVDTVDSANEAAADSAELARLESLRQDSIRRESAAQDSLNQAKKLKLMDEAETKYAERLGYYLNPSKPEYNECWSEYFLYDITKDGIPELWLIHGTSEADRALTVYTPTETGLKKIYEGGGGHSSFYKGKNYILRLNAHQGYAVWIKLSYNGTKITEKVIFEEDCYKTEKDYTEPKEPSINIYEVNNTGPLHSTFAKIKKS